MAKILLINANPAHAKGINDATVTPPLGLAYLAARLVKSAHSVQIIDARILAIAADDITEQFTFKPDLVGLSVNIVNYGGSLLVAEKVKKIFPSTPVVFGGPYPSSLSREILSSHTTIDAVVIGEGEETIAEIAGRIGKTDIFEGVHGVSYRKDGIIDNPPRPLIENLDDVPPPAYDLLPDLKLYKSRSRGFPVGYIITSRGCPFGCSFCNRNIFGTAWRPHSVGRVISEIEYLVKEYNVRQLDVFDDNFTLDNNRSRAILEEMLRRGIKLHINLQNGVRVDKTDVDMLKLMKRAGVFKIGFGIESADLSVQKRARKVVDLEKAKMLTKAARRLGIITHGFFIVGLPGDTPETMSKSLKYAIEMDPHFANFSICIPFPGTEIYQDIKANGSFLEDVENGIEAGFSGGKAFYKLPGMDPEDTIRYFKKMYREFYFRPSKMLDMASTVRSLREFGWMANVALEMIGVK